MKINFNLQYNTFYGQKLQLVISDAVYDMHYAPNGVWHIDISLKNNDLEYKYRVINDDNKVLDEELSTHQLHLPDTHTEMRVFDVWNNKNFPENYLNNKILKNSLSNFKAEKPNILKNHTHIFRIEAPLYQSNWRVVLLGNTKELGNWDYAHALPLSQTDYGIWEVGVNISSTSIIEYKYAILDENTKKVITIEYGENRQALSNNKSNIHIQADHYFRFQASELYHAAGVAVPVFSLRTENGFGVGEFSDMKQLADWAKSTKLGVVQILPINDTTANYSWTDSYPYAAISVYALHPQYISLENLDFEIPQDLKTEYDNRKAELNALSLIDYEKMIEGKWYFLQHIFNENKKSILSDTKFQNFISENKKWLFAYASFCVLRDQYNTPNFNDWDTHSVYNSDEIQLFFSEKYKYYNAVMLHAWVQYQLHIQLKDAINYTHSLGISVKGDLPIGIYRYSVEAWTEPELFGMDFQAGAPPDQFTDLGQNWGFPTYNWEKMKEDNYQWWKNRFKALEQYFDAMRIDHILGFFRIWRMPISAVQGILGYFYPAIPITHEEFSHRNIPFQFDRYCKPFINEDILWKYFGEERYAIANFFMNNHFNGHYSFKEEFDTQRKLRDYLDKNPHPWAEEKLLSLCANVLFLAEEREGNIVYHPRFNIHKTDSFQYLSESEQKNINELYVDYFFKRQDELWAKSAMEKLPMILNTTDMLICGEDLGLVPDCVPSVMDRLGITALKVQRMPADNSLWYNPKNAGYMNVVTASSHDSSTLRQWWHEDRELSIKYYYNQLLQQGETPQDLTPHLAEIIMKQHLYNEAMLAIFPIQEFMATDKDLVNPFENDERINDPAVFPHYWRYRMHIPISKLNEAKDFNNKISGWVKDSGR